MALTAAHCAKTLIAASSTGSTLLHQCAKLLIPGMVEYLAKVAALREDAATLQKHVLAAGEVVKAFGVLFTSVAEEIRTSQRYSSSSAEIS